MKIITGTYESNATFAGWVEPEDKSWIVFVRHDGGHDYFGKRDPLTGSCA
jgi:hypothetical protein